MPPVRVFISYSRDSPEHERRVRKLADRLRRDEFDVRLDQYQDRLSESVPVWIDRELEAANYVLVIISETYAQRPGSAFEHHWIMQALYEAKMANSKYVPVVLEEADKRFLSRVLRSYRFFCLDNDGEYEALKRHLKGRNETGPPPPVDPGRPEWQRIWRWVVVAVIAVLIVGLFVWRNRLVSPGMVPPQNPGSRQEHGSSIPEHPGPVPEPRKQEPSHPKPPPDAELPRYQRQMPSAVTGQAPESTEASPANTTAVPDSGIAPEVRSGNPQKLDVEPVAPPSPGLAKPPSSSSAEKQTTLEDTVLATLQSLSTIYRGKAEFSLAENSSTDDQEHVRRLASMPPGERLLALIATKADDPEDVIAFGEKGLYYHHHRYGTGSISYQQLPGLRLERPVAQIIAFGNGDRFSMTGSRLTADDVIKILQSVQNAVTTKNRNGALSAPGENHE